MKEEARGALFDAFMRSIYSARKRSNRKAMTEPPLTRKEAVMLWERAKGACEVTGIPFSLEQSSDLIKKRPWAPSADKIDPAGSYNVENVRIVCVAVNIAMNQWGVDVLYRIGVAVMKSGRAPRMSTSKHHTTALPADVRLYRGTHGVRYVARARDFGAETHLGYFQTVDEALEARLTWARRNRSEKVLRQVYDATQDPCLAEEIERLSLG